MTFKNRFTNGMLSIYAIYLFYGFRGLIEGGQYLESEVVHQSILLFIYVCSAIYMLASPRQKINVFGFKFVLLILVFCALSALWSAESAEVLKSAAALFGTAIFGTLLAKRFGVKLADYLTNSILLYVLLLLPLYLIGVDLGLGSIADSSPFMGLSIHKNPAGIIFGFAAVLYYGAFRQRPVKWSASLVLLMVLATVMTSSSTSILGIFGAIFVLEIAIVSKKMRLNSFWASAVLGLIICLTLIVLSFYILEILNILDKDLTMSSRTLIWEIVINNASDNFWFGPGYGTFWGDYSEANLDAASIFYGTTFKQSHNGILDVWAQSGIVGLALFASFLLYGLRRSYVMLQQYNGYAIFSGLVFVLFNNMGEANMFTPNYFTFCFIVYSVCLVRSQKY